MKTWTGLAAAVVLFTAGLAQASYPCGLYARIDKVEFEPGTEKPDRVKVYGDFIVVMDTGRLNSPERGFVYFSLVDKKEDQCRTEWRDLEEVSKGTQYVAIGSAFSEEFKTYPEVHKKGAKDPKPVPYPLNHGLSRLRARDNDVGGDRNPVVMLQKYLASNPLPKP